MGQSIRVVNADGTVTCEADSDTTYSAGTGLDLAGTQFSLEASHRLPQGCAVGQIAAWNGSVWICEQKGANPGTPTATPSPTPPPITPSFTPSITPAPTDSGGIPVHDLPGSASTAAYATLGGGDGNTSSGSSADPGDAQAGLYVLRAETPVGQTNTYLYLDGTGEDLAITKGRTMAFDILLVARSEDSESAGYVIQGMVEYDTPPGARHEVNLVGTPTVTTLGENTTGWRIGVDVDPVNDLLYIETTCDQRDGPIRWVATVRTAVVSWPEP
jgi:hypothetical protein